MKHWQLEQNVYVGANAIASPFILNPARSLATFRELGPPDLCHVQKSTGRSGTGDVCAHFHIVAQCTDVHAHGQLGSYHYVSGVDASSSASLAAYINSLTYAIEDSNTWFSKSAIWKVKNGCYW